MITIASIQRAVAREYELPLAALVEPFPRGKRGLNIWPVAHPRQTAMALSVLLTEHSRTRIGFYFGGRDRSTVYHACSAVESRRRNDPKLHNLLRRLTFELVRSESTTFAGRTVADWRRLEA